MYTDIQLESIRLFGRKDKKMGCLTLNKDGEMWYAGFNNDWKIVHSNDGLWGCSSDYGEYMGEILGHIPHLEDLFRVAIEKGFFVSLALQSRGEYVLSIYGSDTQNSYTYTPTIPLLDQPSLPEIVKLFS